MDISAPAAGRRPVVHDRRLRGLEEERQEDARRDEHDEAVQRDLAEEERPAVREDVTQLLAQQAAAAEVGVQPAAGRTQRRPAHAKGAAEAPLEVVVAPGRPFGVPLDRWPAAVHVASQKPGPTDSVKSLCA